jgi:hypothetical protein
MLNGNLRVEAGTATLLETRKLVQRGWDLISEILVAGAEENWPRE